MALMMEIKAILSFIGFKDLLIIISTAILVFCVIKIRKLKKELIKEIHKRLIPELSLDIDLDRVGIFIKNNGCLMAKDIIIEDLEIDLADYGFRAHFTLLFEPIETLRPEQRTKVNFSALHKGEEKPAKSSDIIVPHLVSANFKLKVNYSNIENLKFCAEFIKKDKSFSLEAITSCQ